MQAASPAATARPPLGTTLQWAAALGDPRDHSKTARLDLVSLNPWLPPGKRDERPAQSKGPGRPQSARLPVKPQNAAPASRPSSRRRSFAAARQEAKALQSREDMLEPPLNYVELSELVWRLRLENEELRRGQSSHEDESAKAQAAQSALQAQMDALKAQLAEEQQRTVTVEANNRELFSENGRLLDRVHGLETEAAKERRCCAKLEADVRALQKRVEELTGERDAARSKKDQIASKLVSTEQMLSSEQRENELMMRAAAEAEFKKRIKEAEDWKARQAFGRSRRKAGVSKTVQSRSPRQKLSPRTSFARTVSSTTSA